MIVSMLCLSACQTVKDVDTVAKTGVEREQAGLSTAPLADVSNKDVLFAQIALTQLNYDIGDVDGIWGSRSEKALQDFEQKNNIDSAGGQLSRANLHALSKATKVREVDLAAYEARQAPSKTPNETRSVATDIDEKALDDSPKLVLLDKPYPMMAKPNPFSEQVAVLQPGAGVYVISLEGGWYEIESLDEQRGFIKALSTEIN